MMKNIKKNTDNADNHPLLTSVFVPPDSKTSNKAAIQKRKKFYEETLPHLIKKNKDKAPSKQIKPIEATLQRQQFENLRKAGCYTTEIIKFTQSNTTVRKFLETIQTQLNKRKIKQPFDSSKGCFKNNSGIFYKHFTYIL